MLPCYLSCRVPLLIVFAILLAIILPFTWHIIIPLFLFVAHITAPIWCVVCTVFVLYVADIVGALQQI